MMLVQETGEDADLARGIVNATGGREKLFLLGRDLR